MQNLTGEVWVANVLTGEKRALVSDRPADNPWTPAGSWTANSSSF